MVDDLLPHSVLAPALAQLAALGEDPNVTRAAARSGTSQSTLSRAIRRWEERLGIKLLMQDGRGVRLTAEGSLLAAAAEEAAQVLDDAVLRLRGHAARSVTVGFLKSLGPTVVGELVGSFLSDVPAAVVAHREGTGSELLRGLDEGSVDIAVTTQPPPPYKWLALGRQAFVLVVPTGHRLAGSEPVALETAREERFLALDRRFDARRRADNLCARAGFTPRIVLEADDVTTVRGYVGAALGVAVLPADTSTAARTVDVSIRSASPTWREFGLAWLPHRADAEVEALLEHAARLGEKYPGWADILT
ncbi:LysR family transcriptional regulator [Streptomyces atratus]|uniref:LysR family transcriptional regulator n=1 Tax=Streptomyces atratus TaxID=1893 RepID=UPI002256A19C|nr:LysR family transcriptional regulator [Streptomyces atratus]MCX5339215.1 LysR family transcriptional regulator [Streptomyces atratus]